MVFSPKSDIKTHIFKFNVFLVVMKTNAISLHAVDRQQFYGGIIQI